MAKGLLSRETLQDIIAPASAEGKTVLVDPERSDDYSGYKGATCLLPNRSEA
jgi:bifunctional ADP-heptose synthase (sugar kinase/adenylyltransferase)